MVYSDKVPRNPSSETESTNSSYHGPGRELSFNGYSFHHGPGKELFFNGYTFSVDEYALEMDANDGCTAMTMWHYHVVPLK